MDLLPNCHPFFTCFYLLRVIRNAAVENCLGYFLCFFFFGVAKMAWGTCSKLLLKFGI